MPNKPRPPMEKAANLKEYVGSRIEIVGTKTVVPKTGFQAGKERTIAVLASGKQVWLSDSVMGKFVLDDNGKPIPNGSYTVYTYIANGKNCYGLQDESG